jgi:peptidoglycan biosynthesis protein MviN/MurJ (putative lipid II flippase)
VLAISIPAQLLVIVLAAVFVVQGNAVFPMKVGIANVLLNIGLNFAFRPVAGVVGIALSTTLTESLLAVVYVLGASRSFGSLRLAAVWQPLFQSLGSAVAIGIVAEVLLVIFGAISSRADAILVTLVVGLLAFLIHSCVLVAAKEPLALEAVVRLRRVVPGSTG